MPDYEYEQPQSNLRPIKNNQEFRQPKQKSPDEIGCCWKKQNSNGVEYLSIKLEENGTTRFLKGFLFSAKRDGDTKPDFIIYKSKGNKNNN